MVDSISRTGQVYSAKELKHIEKVDQKFNLHFVQNQTVPPDLSTPEGRMAARVGNFANQFMDNLLADGGAFEWTV